MLPAKGGVNALTREWAVELLPYQIRVNAVLPAEVDTPQYATWIVAQKDAKANIASHYLTYTVGQSVYTTQKRLPTRSLFY